MNSNVSARQYMTWIDREFKTCGDDQLMIYLNIPFCSYKCSFCHWVWQIPVKELRSDAAVSKLYVKALCEQIRFIGPRLTDIGYIPRLIYWGGGTPSKLEAEDIAQLDTTLHESFELSRVEEYTMETSPETLTPVKLQTMRSAGINRVSVGVQTLDDDELRRSGRGHTAKQAEQAIEMIRDAGFGNYNVDLMVGLPEQDPEAMARTLQRILDFEPPHITVYTFNELPGTIMGKQILKGFRNGYSVLEKEGFYYEAKELLEQAGYRAHLRGYFATSPEYVFKSEEHYFVRRGDYIGFGSGAHSIVGHHYALNLKGNLNQFIAYPLQFDLCKRIEPTDLEIISDLTADELYFTNRINKVAFRRLYGFDLSVIRSDSRVVEFLGQYESPGSIVEETESEIRIRRRCDEVSWR